MPFATTPTTAGKKRERESDRERVCVCVCVRERERERVSLKNHVGDFCYNRKHQPQKDVEKSNGFPPIHATAGEASPWRASGR
jgi:hypothetical protein